ncbi:MAG: class I SAM-dependent methyltransferase [Phycisphaerae bacterium]|nr:class I SAM-dependent methyltransferase [Phycisphaerae bacterium]
MRADWYEFPGWYDILHAAGTAREVDGLSRMEERFSEARGRRVWFEPACGTGRYLRVAAGRGIGVIGLDRSAKMIEYARSSLRNRGLRGELIVGDMTKFRTRRKATFAFCPINTIRHLRSDSAMLAHFACVRCVLLTGGVYAVGIETCRYGEEFPSEDVWEGRRGAAHVRQTVQYLPGKRGRRAERVISHLAITTPRGVQHLDSRYDLRTYSFEQWSRLIARAGWTCVAVCNGDGDDAMRGPHGAVVGDYGVHILKPR